MYDQNANNDNQSYFDENHNYHPADSSGTSHGSPFSTSHPTPAPQKGNGRFGRSVLLVLLCVCVSFGAGFGGALYAQKLANQRSGGTDEINDPPNGDNLNNENPDEVLDKTGSAPSLYGSAGEDVFAVSDVVRMVEDSVVVIDVTVRSNSIFGGSTTSTGSGSGVIISADGYILTCNHVVENAESVVVTLNSGSKYEAALVGSDASSDLAVLQIAPKETLTYARQGCSADLVVGETVVAIGNPLGTLGGTVTDGIISATERTISMSDGTQMTLLQTNAAINSGNSGGGLFNLDGKLIGIVNAKYASEGVEGLAFAIPIDSAFLVEQDLIRYGYVRGVVDDGLSTLDITEANLRYYYYNFKID
ncbi:MAG: trypsin-like peptidase domain-containing protein, partial [Clostridia bacterium]|nr:trypsin-like peptidase domain-containing protein [Clostridia bacterium]